MSLESIGIIGILTLLTIVLGADLFFLLVGLSALGTVADATLLDAMGHIHQVAAQRISFVFVVLFAGAVAVNLVPHQRTEVYLLKIGLGSLILYALLVLLGSRPLSNRMIEALDSGSIENVRSWHNAWQWFLWPRAVTALVSFWSFLHYAMNPKV